MNKPKTRNENIVIQEMNAELLIYDLKDNKAFCLNETSAIIYQLCDGKRTIAEINKAVAKKLNQPVNDELIWLALDGLKKEGLLENSDIEIDFNGLNRRQIIRKVGLASLIALPMVSMVVAPQAAQANSCIGLGQPCAGGNGAGIGQHLRGNCCLGQGYCGGTCVSCFAPGIREITGYNCGSYNLTINSTFADCFNDTLCVNCLTAQEHCCSGEINASGSCA